MISSFIRRSNLSYPAGIRPRLNITHPACRSLLDGVGISVISVGGNLINLINGQPGTIVGSVSAKVDGITGPYTTLISNFGGNGITFPGKALAANPFLYRTCAAIIRLPASGGSHIFSDDSVAGFSGGILFMHDGTNLVFGNTSSGGQLAIGGMTASDPYFVVGWMFSIGGFGASPSKLFWRNLRTGQTAYTSGSPNQGGDSSNGTYAIGYKYTNNSLTLNLAALMFSVGWNPSEQDIRAWGDDPWATWFADINLYRRLLEAPNIEPRMSFYTSPKQVNIR